MVVLGIILLFVCVWLSGCSTKTGEITNNPLDIERNKFVGTWKLNGNNEVTLTFYSNGTNVYIVNIVNDTNTSIKGTWEINNGTFTNTLYQFPRNFTYSFSDNNRTLTLTAIDGGEVTVFTKQ